jgi:hypothetical protein
VAASDRAKVAKAIEAGLPGSLKKADGAPKAAALPPIPLPEGVAAAVVNPQQAARDKEQIEAFESAARAAAAAMVADEGERIAQMAALSRELEDVLRSSRSVHASWESVGEAKAALAWAALAAWLGAPVLAAVMGYGVRATAAIPAGWIAALWAWAMAKGRRGARAAASYALAPTASELAELQARVAMHKKRVDEMRRARAMGPHAQKAPKPVDGPSSATAQAASKAVVEGASLEPVVDASAVAEAMAAIEKARPARRIEAMDVPVELVRTNGESFEEAEHAEALEAVSLLVQTSRG